MDNSSWVWAAGGVGVGDWVWWQVGGEPRPGGGDRMVLSADTEYYGASQHGDTEANALCMLLPVQ